MGHTSEKRLPRVADGARVMRCRNAAWCAAATWFAAILLPAGPITAQYAPPGTVPHPSLAGPPPGLMERLAEQQKAQGGGGGEHRPPSPAGTMRVYRAIADIVHGWKEDFTLTASSTEVEPPAFSGVCITLRLDGQVIGRGQAIEPPTPPHDIPRIALAPDDWRWNLISTALREAMDEARPQLPKTNDAFAEEARKLAARRIIISLELAGDWTPITPKTWLDAEMMLEPGLDGVAARRGGTLGHAVFPSTMLAMNRLPHIALAGAAAEAIGEAGGGGAAAVVDKPSVFTKKHNVALYRFRTTHLAQAAPGEEPIFLTRGQRVVELSGLSRASLADAAEQLTDHLLSRIVELDDTHEAGDKAEVKVIGVYQPWLGKAAENGQSARPDEMALMAYALVRYSRLESLGEERQMELLAAAEKLNLAINKATSEDALSRENVSVTLANLCYEDTLCRLHRTSMNVSIDHYPEANRLFGASRSTSASQLPLAIKSVVLFEEMQRFIDDQQRSIRPMPGQDELDELDARMRTVYTETPASQLVMHMPWLGWAEQQRAVAKQWVVRKSAWSREEDDAISLPEIPAAPALRQVREQVWAHQLSELDTGPFSADMAGGIVFTKGQGTPLPTWQTARPIAFFGSMLVDDRLTDKDERPLELAKLLQSLRFLRQLQADESQMWMFADPARSLGGVRAAVWDQSMPLDASSFTLMAYTEAIRALDEMRK